MIESFLPLHPRFVHFPIALLLVGAAFVAGGLLRPGATERWLWAGRWLIFLGWIGVIVAGITGLVDQSQASDTPAVRDTINLHITAGIALLIVFGLALYWPLKDKRLWRAGSRPWSYLALLLLGVLLVLVEGWLGGQLVYTLGVGVR